MRIGRRRSGLVSELNRQTAPLRLMDRPVALAQSVVDRWVAEKRAEAEMILRLVG